MGTTVLHHICFSIAFFISIIVGAVLAGVGKDELNPPNMVMFWIGVGLLILAGFIVINWITTEIYINGIYSNDNTIIFHSIFFQVGLIFMIVGAATMSHQSVDYTLHWIGLGFLMGWVITWVIWAIISVYGKWC